jgi:hypothetical protein
LKDNITGEVYEDHDVNPGETCYYLIKSVDPFGNESTNSDLYSIRVTNATPPTFTQADLTGTWDLYQFQVGDESAGWFRAVVNLDVSGIISIVNYEDTMGDSNPPGPTGLWWTINTNGVVTQTGDLSSPSFHGTMASNKQLIVGTVTLDPSTKGIRVARKRVPGVIFNSSDIWGKTFVYHSLSDGALRKLWEYGFGYMDSTGKSTIASYVDPDGTHIGQSEYYLSIDSEGIVTRSGNSTFKGIMTPDKSAIFVVATLEPEFGTIYSLGVLQITGQTFSQQDLAGTYGFYDLFVSQSDAGWLHGKVSIDSSGLGSFTDLIDDYGPRAPFTASITLAQDGTVTIPGNPTLHGTFSRTGNLIATTHTNSLGGFELGLFVK